jgi:hypothetical protein
MFVVDKISFSSDVRHGDTSGALAEKNSVITKLDVVNSRFVRSFGTAREREPELIDID